MKSIEYKSLSLSFLSLKYQFVYAHQMDPTGEAIYWNQLPSAEVLTIILTHKLSSSGCEKSVQY